MEDSFRMALCLVTTLCMIHFQTCAGSHGTDCSVRIQLSPQHQIEHLLCTEPHHANPENRSEAIESALRSFLVEKDVLEERGGPALTKAVYSPWYKMEAIVAKFKEFLKSREQPEEVFIIHEPTSTEETAPKEQNQPNSAHVALIVRQHAEELLLGRPLGDHSKLDLVGAFQEADGLISVLFKHKKTLRDEAVQTLQSFTVKQRNHGSGDLPFTHMRCVASSGRTHASCVTDRTCWIENLYYYRGRWVVHADGENVYQVRRNDLAKSRGSIYTWPWVARTQSPAGKTEDMLLEPSRPFVQLSTHASTGLMGLWSFEVAGDNLRHIRQCRGSSCLNVSTVEETVLPVMRTEPETFGHLLVDTFYPADWAAHDLNLTLPAKVKLVAMDPFERFTYQGLNDLYDSWIKIVGSTGPLLRNGDDICGPSNICRLRTALVGIGCRGLFFSPRDYSIRQRVARSTRSRALRSLGIHPNQPLCRMQITIVLRKQKDGRSFCENDVNQLERLIHETFAVPTRLVYLEDLSVERQVRTLHDTAILICMDGSALDLLPFAREDMAVIVIVPSNRAYGHWRLLQSVGSIGRHYVLRARLREHEYHLPLQATRAAVEASLVSLQRIFEKEECKNWWYFSSEAWADDESVSRRRRSNWLAEAAHVLQLNPAVACTEHWPEPFDRNGMLKVLQRILPARRILEIGCTSSSYERFANNGQEIQRYVCVDPLSGQGPYKTTSDSFFGNSSGSEFDLIFIDGLHTSIQAERDIDNALKILSTNGVIAVHDSNPRHRIESESTYYGTYSCPYNIQVRLAPTGTNSWNGDVWRAIARVKAKLPGLNVATLPLDWGLTLIRRSTKSAHSTPSLEDQPEELLTFEMLDQSRLVMLNMISICELPSFLQQ